MACNENIIKNIANEVTRNCQSYNITNVEAEFVVYLIELLLLNPKYGKMFSKTLTRNCLASFVNECIAMIKRGGTTLGTLKIQYIMQTSYGSVPDLISKHRETVNSSLAPLLNEIVDSDPGDTSEYQKVYRKMSIYILVYSGLGNPSNLLNLKEGMTALGSVFSLSELGKLLMLPHAERIERVEELTRVVSGVRLFNRDCKKGGEMVPDLPFDLVDACNASISSLSNTLVSVMLRVNTLTSAVEQRVVIDNHTGFVRVEVEDSSGVTIEDYNHVFGLLIFNRQYEIYTRRLLNDVEALALSSKDLVRRYQRALDDIHEAVKYKTAVPCDTVYPLFCRLWAVWRAMQDAMYVVGTVDRLAGILKANQDTNKIPNDVVSRMLAGRTIITDEERRSSVHENITQLSQVSMSTQQSNNLDDLSAKKSDEGGSSSTLKNSHVMFLGFCVMCLNVGALVPSDLKTGLIKYRGNRYAFSSLKMATKFAKHPERYINEVIEVARNNPQIINLLDMDEEVRRVKDIDTVVIKPVTKKIQCDKDIQTLVHPLEENMVRHYSWDLWEWKRRACQWANIVNCQTHSTQTDYSHMRSEIHCQTVEPRDKNLQTMKDAGINTNTCNFFFWGLRGQIGTGQHFMDMVPKHKPENAKPLSLLMEQCPLTCDGCVSPLHSSGSEGSDDSAYNNSSA